MGGPGLGSTAPSSPQPPGDTLGGPGAREHCPSPPGQTLSPSPRAQQPLAPLQRRPQLPPRLARLPGPLHRLCGDGRPPPGANEDYAAHRAHSHTIYVTLQTSLRLKKSGGLEAFSL